MSILTHLAIFSVLCHITLALPVLPARSVQTQTLANLRHYSTHNNYDGADSDGDGESDGAYSWGYQWTDEFGNQMFREEICDGVTTRGRYSFRDSSGIIRIVEYISDENGFRTRIRTNEPGVVSSNPAGAQIIKFEDENHIPQ